MSFDTIEQAMADLAAGKMIILVDDEDRENEGDLVMAAECVRPTDVNFMAKEARGLICLALSAERVGQLQLPPMVNQNRSRRRTAFTVSIEARDGITTGISAHDRATTIQTVMKDRLSPDEIVSPGHVFPLAAREGGVLFRGGHTEGSVDLARLAGLKEAAVICEIMNDDGSMARRPHLQQFAKKHALTMVSIEDLIRYRRQHESLVTLVAEATLPIYGLGEFHMKVFQDRITGLEHVVLQKGDVSEDQPALVRVHSECLTGDVFASARCDCGWQLAAALKKIADEGGVFLYMKQEGRGIGLTNKIKAYALQEQGMDTVEANHHLGFKDDERDYGIGSQILKQVGLKKIRLLTNNPRKIVGIQGYDLDIVSREPIESVPQAHNEKYLQSKKDKLGHLLNLASHATAHHAETEEVC